MPEVHGLVGSQSLESIGALLSAATQPYKAPSKDIDLINIHVIRSHHVHEAC